jgi:hypothetical protein
MYDESFEKIKGINRSFAFLSRGTTEVYAWDVHREKIGSIHPLKNVSVPRV